MRARTLVLLFAGAVAVVAAADATLSFPRDHGSHPDAALEWWYWTGHLQSDEGAEFGFQLTFFRLRELHLAHFAWSDLGARRFTYEQKAHLGLPGIAGASESGLDVFNEDWFAREERVAQRRAEQDVQGRAEQGVQRRAEQDVQRRAEQDVQGSAEIRVQRLRARGEAGEISLTLTPEKPPVLHGEDGISRKGPGPDEYSHYVSIPRLSVSGTWTAPGGGRARTLRGNAWFDHEWGPGGLPAGTLGWDWFALQLSDGSELMLYRMRTAAGASPFSSGTFVPATGSARAARPDPERVPVPVQIAWKDVSLSPRTTWRSPHSNATYPAVWSLAVAPLDLDVTLTPLLADQELSTEKSTGVTYWEGACRVEGRRGGRPIGGRAYVEMTGYAGRDVPGFGGPGKP